MPIVLKKELQKKYVNESVFLMRKAPLEVRLIQLSCTNIDPILTGPKKYRLFQHYLPEAAIMGSVEYGSLKLPFTHFSFVDTEQISEQKKPRSRGFSQGEDIVGVGLT